MSQQAQLEFGQGTIGVSIGFYPKNPNYRVVRFNRLDQPYPVGMALPSEVDTHQDVIADFIFPNEESMTGIYQALDLVRQEFHNIKPTGEE